MLRVSCRDDIDRVYVVRIDDVTVIYRPTVADTATVLEQSARLLTAEEQAIIRSAHGLTAANARETLLRRWPTACPCSIPARLRSPLDATPCPLHIPIDALTA